MPLDRPRLALATLLAAVLAGTLAPPMSRTDAASPAAERAAAVAKGPKPLRVFTSSNRPDLISGGDARVAIEVTPLVERTTLRVR